MPKKYAVLLTEGMREELNELVAQATASPRELGHARILLQADQAPGGPATLHGQIAEAVAVSEMTVTRVCRRFAEGGLKSALHRKVQQNRKAPTLNRAQEALLIALFQGAPPEGHTRWSLRLLADQMVKLEHANRVSHETVRQVLKRAGMSLS